MALHLITGQSGTGKSTLLTEFKNRGLDAFGYDEDGIGVHSFVSNGLKLTARDYRAPRKQQIDWVNDINYLTDEIKFSDLLDRSESQEIYLFGSAKDTPNYYHYFSKIFALVVDASTLQERLKNRTGNDWGKKPHELAFILARYKTAEKEYRAIGATIINADQSVGKIADEIIRHTTES